MKLHPPAHKLVGDAGKPGQIIHNITEPYNAAAVELQLARDDPMYRHAGMLARDLMYQHGISPFSPAQKQARTLKDTL